MTLGSLPGAELLQGIAELDPASMLSQPGAGPGPEHWSAISKSLAQLAKQHKESPAAAQVSVGMGLPAITKKLLQKIQANEYLDFGELPPAKGKTKSVPQSLEGQVIDIQAAELYKQRKSSQTWLPGCNVSLFMQQ